MQSTVASMILNPVKMMCDSPTVNETSCKSSSMTNLSIIEEKIFDYEDLPLDMRFNEGHVVSIVFYSILMVLSAIGNITVLTLLVRRNNNRPRTRINKMLIHLAIADLLVCTRRKEKRFY